MSYEFLILLAVLLAIGAAVVFYMRKHPEAIAQLRADFAAHAATVNQRVDDLTRQPITVNVNPAPAPVPVAATAIDTPPAPDAAPVVLEVAPQTPPGTPLGNLDANNMTRRLMEDEDASKPRAAPITAPAAASVVDRWRGWLDFAPSAIQFWKGGAGDITALPVTVPKGWRGTLEVMAAESSEAGAKVDQFDLWLSTMPKQPGPGTWPRFDRGPQGSISVHIDQDVDVVYVNVHQWQPGGGYVQLNPQSA